MITDDNNDDNDDSSGSHNIEILYDGINIQSSPFTVDVRKPRVYVEEFPACAYVGKPAMFKRK